MHCQGIVIMKDTQIARLNHSDTKHFKLKPIKHNRQKFLMPPKEDMQLVQTTILEKCMKSRLYGQEYVYLSKTINNL